MSAFDSFTPHNVCFIEVPKAFQERKTSNEERRAALTNQMPFFLHCSIRALKEGVAYCITRHTNILFLQLFLSFLNWEMSIISSLDWFKFFIEVLLFIFCP